MTAIIVTVGPSAPDAELKPRYDNESQILAAESPASTEWSFGVDVEGRIVFDLGSDRTLRNFDLHIGKQFWAEERELGWPDARQRGTLVFAPETIDTQSFHLPLYVRTDPARELVRIEIGERASGTLVALSDTCVAMLLGNGELSGFTVRLGRDP